MVRWRQLLAGWIGISLMASVSVASQPNVLHELWRDLPGGAVRDLTSCERYVQAPDEVRLLEGLDVGSMGDRFGARLTTLLTPPKTGEYTFWIASDDGSELWLGEDETAQRLRLIASVQGWTRRHEWENQSSQRSRPVGLQSGKQYLLRVLHKDEGGLDHVSVAWQGPGIERAVIAPQYLALPALTSAQRAAIQAAETADRRRQELQRRAESFWSKGEDLPVEFADELSASLESPPADDRGINVLVDQAHQTTFAVLWGLRGKLRSQGFRACTSLASLAASLSPGRLNRIRLRVGDMEPFAWWRTPKFQVVILEQHDLNAQPYTEDERAAVRRFVESGGGALVMGRRPPDQRAAGAWSLNALLSDFGAGYTPAEAKSGAAAGGALKLSKEWEPLLTDEKGQALRARRAFGRGRIMVVEGVSAFNPGRGEPKPAAAEKVEALAESVTWLAGDGRGGSEDRMAHLGGAGIYPEREQKLGSVIVYYAANQKPEVLNCIQKDIPDAARRLRAWLPTKVFGEPYHLVICAGGGGGWAINTRPKAAAVISYDPLGILGIFGHEMAHTMGGPRNAKDELAGISPHHNQGEAHAGWFQGKIQALYDPSQRSRSNRGCNRILEMEKKKGRQLDLAREYENELGRKEWGKGAGWTKMWWVWQKLDDRYGPTWYPRWYWVRATRWQAEPSHRETWEEMIEDMSIAVAEDLFPFFHRIGTTLKRQRLATIDFQGETLHLPVAPLDAGPGGPVRLDPIGDYTKPLPSPH